MWLSEIMLQQTRVEAVKGYYARFLTELPTIAALADCPPDRLTKPGRGCGYYSRSGICRRRAKIIGGIRRRISKVMTRVRALPGIGDYTAGQSAQSALILPRRQWTEMCCGFYRA